MSVPAGCQFVLQRGKNKGQLCGKTASVFSGGDQLCLRHLVESQSVLFGAHAHHDGGDQDAPGSPIAMFPSTAAAGANTPATITVAPPPFPCVHNKAGDCRKCGTSCTLAQCIECDMVGPKAAVVRHGYDHGYFGVGTEFFQKARNLCRPLSRLYWLDRTRAWDTFSCFAIHIQRQLSRPTHICVPSSDYVPTSV